MLNPIRKIAASIFFIFCCFGVLSACSAVFTEEQQQLNPNIPEGILGFETVFACYETGMIGGSKDNDLYESRVRMYYLREKLTDTMYIWRTSGRDSSPNGYSYWSSGMTVMLNPETGGPLTYDAFLQYIHDMRILCSKCNKEFDELISYCPDCGSAILVEEESIDGK